MRLVNQLGRLAGLIMFSLNTGCTWDTDMTPEMYGWAASKDLVTGAGVNAKFKGIVIQAQLPRDDSLTTQFNVTGGPANCRARITSLVNGNAVVRLVTVIDGASITTRGKNINVELGDFTDTSISNGRTYQVAVLSTLGVRANIEQPPILQPLAYRATAIAGPLLPIQAAILVPAGITAYIPIPIDSGVNAVFVSAISGNPTVAFGASEIRIQQIYGVAGNVLREYNPIAYPTWIPIAPGADQIAFRNDHATASATFTATFGVDG